MKWPSNIKIAAGASAVAVGVAGLLVQFLPVEEGRRLGAYRDPIGIPTICEGWTRGVQMGDRATQAECDMLTRQGIQEAWEVFERWVPAHVRNGMHDQTLAAFLSFIYNVGPGQAGSKDGFVWLKSGRHSTMLLRLQAGDVRAACEQLPAWVTAAGIRLRGLELRRGREMAMCLEAL